MVQMGFESIVLAGVDLCFRADGQSHESGSLENKIGRFVHNSTQYVKTNGGEMAPTSSDFLTAQVTLQAQVRGIKESLPNVRIINPAPSAAYVEGVAYVPLGELVLPSWKNERYERVQSCIEPLKFDESVFLKHTLKVTQAMRLKLTRTIGHAQKGLAVAKVLFDQSSKIPARTKQLLLAKDKLEKALGDDLPLLMDYAPAKFNDTFLTNTEKKQENSDIQSAFVTYFNAIIESGNLLLTNFDHAIALTQLRQLESSSVTLTQTLVDQWMRFGQPGRLHHWLDRWGRAENELTEAELVIATPALRAYDAIFKVAETGIAKKFKKNVLENTLASVRQAMLVDTEDNITKLDEVLQYCEERAEDDFYRDLGLFILGHFNKLRGDTAQAYQVWGMVEHFKIRQDALKQSLLLSMKVNDYEQSFLALERLCILNRAYLVVYANLLQTMGQVSNAIEVLQTYTKLSPDDIAARLQLVSLLKSEKRLSDAQAELQLAHQLSPTNPVIRRMLSDMGGHLLGEFALDGNFL
jgi:tetratricopeptide (TPR) repeat protein